jgi:hypothetical protein
VLKAVSWALTGAELNIKNDVRSWLEHVAVEISIDDQTFTIYYSPRAEQSEVVGDIYANDLDRVLAAIEGGEDLPSVQHFSDAKEMKSVLSDFFGTELGFAPLQWVESRQLTRKPKRNTIGWDVYSQILIIGADDYSDYLFPFSKRNSRHHQRTLATYLGLTHSEAVSLVEAAREEARVTLRLEKHRFSANAQDAKQRISDIEEELRQVEERLQAIEAGQSVLVDPTYLKYVRGQVSEYTRQIVELTEAEQGLLAEERRLQDDRNKHQRTCRELTETLEFKLFLSGFPVERCPHCEQAIPEVRVEEELHTKQCRVCHSALRPINATDQYERLLDNARATVEGLKTELQRVRPRVKAVRRELETAQANLTKYKAELQDLPRQERAGFTEELRTLLNRRGFLRGQLEQLKDQTSDTHQEYLRDLKHRAEILYRASVQLQSAVLEHHDAILRLLEIHTTALAKSFRVPNLEAVSLTKNLELFVTQAGRRDRFADMNLGEQLRLKIAFHLALLTLRVAHGLGRHPAFLIVDSPGGGELDDQRINEIMTGFVGVRNSLGNQIQILIASAKDALAEACEPDKLDRREIGEKLF